MELIDIHTHILPGFDDGARDLKQSMAMAEAAIQDGVSLMVATPHVIKGSFDNHKSDILKHVQTLNQCLAYAGLKLPVLPGAEYRMEPDLPQRLAAGQLLTLNDTGRYLLVELPAVADPEYAGNILHALQLQGVTPIIANPEGNLGLVKNPEILARFAARGILAQVTVGSITGLFGRRANRAALNFLQSGAAQLISSNGHSTKGREPVLYGAFQAIESRWGVDFARKLTFRNPNYIIKGLPANYPEIEKIAQAYNMHVLEDSAQGFGGMLNERSACRTLAAR